MTEIIPFDRYPKLPPLFRAFLRGLPDFYPDPPEAGAAAARARQLLGRPARVAAAAFRHRRPEGRQMAEALAAGRAVAVAAGHQVGLFTGPLFALLKAFDAIRVAREISASGTPAVPVFYALTDDHDLEEIAKTARPGPEGPESLVLEGADRANRRPVGPLPIPAKVVEIVDAFRSDARMPGADEILEAFARRSLPGVSYADAFIETLLDLVDPEPLLILDPLAPGAAAPAAAFFLEAVRREAPVRDAWRQTAERLEASGQEVPVPYRAEVFPFFAIEDGERRRVGSLDEAGRKAASDKALPSADVLTRPALKSWLLPMAASILGPSEIAYHAQALALLPLFDLPAPVLLPRTHAVLERLTAIALQTDGDLAALESGLEALDATLTGALETTRRKVTYQIEQLVERIRKAAERRGGVAAGRRRRLETMLLPGGGGADRLYPPLVPMLAHGQGALAAIREAATGSREGAAVVELGAEASAETAHAG
jgi:uncharacterized protein YllA (UPF0747 family)